MLIELTSYILLSHFIPLFIREKIEKIERRGEEKRDKSV